MGKVRRARLKLHLPALTGTEKDKKTVQKELKFQPVSMVSSIESMLPPISENPFSGISVSRSQLRQCLVEETFLSPASTLVSTTEEKSVKLHANPSLRPTNKKKRRKRKREAFLEKLETTRRAKAQLKAEKERSSAPVVGDLQPMALALTDINRILGNDTDANNAACNVNQKKKRKPRRLRRTAEQSCPLERYKTIDSKSASRIRSKATQKHMLLEVQRMKKLLSNVPSNNTWY